MLCQYCNTNDAKYHFVVRSEYGSRDIHLCPGCAEKLGRRYSAYLRDGTPYVTAWSMPQDDRGPSPRTAQQGRFPESDDDFAYRRKLRELEIKLEEAVEMEEYELAAQLRDQIRKLQTDSVTRIPIN